jgi:hypothetical protein
MPRRPPVLNAFALLAALAVGEARAHNLIVECHVLPGGKVQVESWFDITEEPADGAAVQVVRTEGRAPVTKGRLDKKGVFAFAVGRDEVAALTVTVNAGAGHRGELQIPQDVLLSSFAPDAKARVLSTSPAASRPPEGVETPRDTDPAAPAPRSDRRARISVQDVLVGVGFVLAVAAFALSVRNARRLAELSQRLNGAGTPPE